jgi:hypothetical protein
MGQFAHLFKKYLHAIIGPLKTAAFTATHHLVTDGASNNSAVVVGGEWWRGGRAGPVWQTLAVKARRS